LKYVFEDSLQATEVGVQVPGICNLQKNSIDASLISLS